MAPGIAPFCLLLVCAALCQVINGTLCQNTAPNKWCRRQIKRDDSFCKSYFWCEKFCDPNCGGKCEDLAGRGWCKRMKRGSLTFCTGMFALQYCKKVCKRCGETTTPPPATTPPPNTPWVVFQRREVPGTSFYKSWASYRKGFADATNTNMWLGLEEIHSMCGSASDKCELRIDMRYNNVDKYAMYSSFYISDSSDNFRLHISGFSGDAGDSMLNTPFIAGGANGMEFSTWDRDNDVHAHLNCAQRFMGAWWYQGCMAANLNGQMNPLWDGSVGSAAMWKTFTDSKPVSFSEMKLRRLPSGLP